MGGLLTRKYGTSSQRWVGLGPYYAMFPSAFADRVISNYSEPGDTVLDPFAGRGTSLFSAASVGRQSIGIELNPVGWLYCRAKLNPAPKETVLARINAIQSLSTAYRTEAKELPPFFKRCFSMNVREFLCCARVNLDWRADNVDQTVMAFLMIHLHGKASDSLSNQMRQTKAMAPQYAIRWWKEHDCDLPDINPSEFFKKKIEWRYAKGIPALSKSHVLLGDSATLLSDLRGTLGNNGMRKPALMLTSPPYFGITNYHYDQWIRLWLLGGPPTDRRASTHFNGKHQGKFANVEVYRKLLTTVFEQASKILRKNANVYVRTDRRKLTLSVTREALQSAFPDHQVKRINHPFTGLSQTRLFGNDDPRFGEVDLLLRYKS